MPHKHHAVPSVTAVHVLLTVHMIILHACIGMLWSMFSGGVSLQRSRGKGAGKGGNTGETLTLEGAAEWNLE